MRKFWVLAMTIVLMIAADGLAERRGPEPAKQPGGYTVASAKDAPIVQRSAPSVPRPGPGRALPGSLPLILVGSLLLGLGAAVRRTT